MRYLPLSPEDRADMLNTIGAASVDDFYTDVPQSARLNGAIAGLPDHQGELSVERHLSALAAKNRSAGDGPFFVGCGAYRPALRIPDHLHALPARDRARHIANAV